MACRVVYTTKKGTSEYLFFSSEDHYLRKACEYCKELKRRNDVISGHVYDEHGEIKFCSFDKLEDL